ncbi:MAG: hypothetical protein H6635_05920 [Anaerolineales bacterium]|nr:hypothetical protein [Anaerolineales bacterium]MCB9144888.1 hypothetical protein [Anaerolineales bacterium]
MYTKYGQVLMEKRNVIFIIFASLFIIPACLGATEQTPTPTLEYTPSTQPSPTIEASQTQLTVCMRQEPNSLYPFGELNDAAKNILSAIYDGPIDMAEYKYQSVILTKLPSFENGDAQIVPVEVQTGDTVLDTNGNIISLKAGDQIRPADCRANDCIVTYNGDATVIMDQMIVTFRLRPDLTWSDGTPLTVDDSIYSFELQREMKSNTYLIERTSTYEAADAQTLHWFGIPGYIDPTYFTNIWQPAPKHAWSEFPANQLSSVDISSRTPLTWGPYSVAEWLPGSEITLEKNPYYYRNEDGYPKIDKIKIRFISDPELALSELIASRCDLIDPTINLEAHTGLLQQMQAAGEAQLFTAPGMNMEWLGLGVNPASYDNGYDIQKDRQNIFADKYTRQAIAYCTDRQTIVDQVFHGLVTVPTSYLPVEHPAFDSNLQPIPYDPEIGISLLEQAGWLNVDNDPVTPRRAINVKDVAYNTPLILNFYTTPTTQRRQVAVLLEDSLATCGIALNVTFLEPNELYAPGPDGLLFGRQFDLAQYALGVESIEPPCNWFVSSTIPNESNTWAGTNITGYSNSNYDAACQSAQLSLREDASYLPSYRQTQITLAEELPAIPLYSHVRLSVASPHLCGFTLDAVAPALWNVESLTVDETCQK